MKVLEVSLSAGDFLVHRLSSSLCSVSVEIEVVLMSLIRLCAHKLTTSQGFLF